MSYRGKKKGKRHGPSPRKKGHCPTLEVTFPAGKGEGGSIYLGENYGKSRRKTAPRKKKKEREEKKYSLAKRKTPFGKERSAH